MPELPEIETIKNGITRIIDCKILEVFTSQLKLRIDSTVNLKLLKNNSILDVKRRARYLLIDLTNNNTLIIHLGMSGRLTLSSKFQQLKHDHFACRLSNNQWLIYNDPRRFGFIDLIKSDDIKNHKMLKNLGPEPLDKNFTSEYLFSKINNKLTNIKTTLMDNKIVVGVGNIYINEALFDAGISPLRSAKSITKTETAKLVKSIKKIISEAIKMGGSSISDYQNADGEFGSFQTLHKTYGRQNEKCFTCQNKIIRITQNQRSSFFCDICQK